MSSLSFTLSSLVVFLALACSSAPPAGHHLVTAVDIQGGSIGNDAALRRGIATRPGVVYDVAVLRKDLERIERFYRGRGYYGASVRAARVETTGNDRVRVDIEVAPGAPVQVVRVDVPGTGTLPPALVADVRRNVSLRVGEPFDDHHFHEAARAVEKMLSDEGFAFARVEERATVSLAARTAAVEYRVTPGPPTVIGAISIEGLRKFDRRVVYAKLELEPGARLSQSGLERARRRLFELGVFSSVDVSATLERAQGSSVPVRVVVREGAIHSVHIGAAIEQDTIRGLAGVRFGWESRNFLQGLRKLSLDVMPAVTLYPLGISDTKLRVMPTFASALRFEQPAFLDARMTGLLGGEFNVYPVTYSDFTPGDNIVGFREIKALGGVERPLVSDKFQARATYEVQQRVPFMYLGEQPAGLDTVFILFPELVLDLDLRDDPIEPHAGAYFQLSTQVAGYFVGDASDVRMRPEARFYLPLGPALTLGLRTTFGFLLPRRCGSDPSRGCYGDSLNSSSYTGSSAALVHDQQVLLFRGFYSGGATSNRGYAFREVGPHGVLGFLAPTSTNCNVPDPPPQCDRPLGGLTLWEASIELRVTLSELAGLVFFVDTSDLTRETVSFRPDYPHLSTGSGFRLRTPVGAVRADLGFRVPYLQHVGAAHLPPEEGDPGEFLHVPLAFHFGLGEAF